LAARGNDAVERCEINRTTDEYAKQRISIRMTNARYSADEHAQNQCVQHGDRHSPRLAGAQTAEKQHAGLLKLDAQPRLG
jgi:hypothetical protein